MGKEELSLSPEEAAKRAKIIVEESPWDKEGVHGQLDQLLCAVFKQQGFDSLVEVFKNTDKWYA